MKKLELKVQKRKEKLWNKGDIESWNLDPHDPSIDFDKLTEDKEYACNTMLPHDNSVL